MPKSADPPPQLSIDCEAPALEEAHRGFEPLLPRLSGGVEPRCRFALNARWARERRATFTAGSRRETQVCRHALATLFPAPDGPPDGNVALRSLAQRAFSA